MSEEKDAVDDDNGTTTPVVDSGTTTKHDGCGCGQWCEKCRELSDADILTMWGELNDANDGKVTNFCQLTDLWFRDLEEYVTTGTVGPGQELPFAVQFFTRGWHPHPKTEDAHLITIREYFCLRDEEGKLQMTKWAFMALLPLLGQYKSMASLFEEKLGLAVQGEVGLSNSARRMAARRMAKPFMLFVTFMSGKEGSSVRGGIPGCGPHLEAGLGSMWPPPREGEWGYESSREETDESDGDCSACEGACECD